MLISSYIAIPGVLYLQMFYIYEQVLSQDIIMYVFQ